MAQTHSATVPRATAAGAAAPARPHVWVRPPWAQQKESRILALEPLRPGLRQVARPVDGQEWSAKSGIKATIDHVPHLQIPAKIAAEVATQSGHDIVQLVGSGTEKWSERAPATSRISPTSSARSTAAGPRWPRTTPGQGQGSSTRIPDFFIDFPGLYRKDLWTEIGMANGPDTWEELHRAE